METQAQAAMLAEIMEMLKLQEEKHDEQRKNKTIIERTTKTRISRKNAT